MFLCERYPEYTQRLRLLIVGEGILREEIERILQSAGVNERAWLCGNRNDIPALMNVMDLFVLPSLAEGISNTILEAMASGLPVVATDVGGNRELVQSGKTGLLVPEGDPEALVSALAGYIRSPEQRQQQAANAREEALKERSLEAMVDKYMMVYDQVIASRGMADRHIPLQSR